jgi:hypothetical protein
MVPSLRNPEDWTSQILGAIRQQQRPKSAEPQQATPPPRPDPARQLEDVLRDLLSGGKSKERPPAK